MRNHSTLTRLGAAIALCVASVGFAAASASPAGAAAGSNSLTVTAHEYSYGLSGAPKAGWTRLTFENRGARFHQLLVVPLKPGVTRAQVQQAVAAGGPESVIPAIGTATDPDGGAQVHQDFTVA